MIYERFLVNPGPRPPYYLVSRMLWGPQADWDSDGDSDPPNSTEWTELTAALRPALVERIDVDRVDDSEPLVLWIRSETEDLTLRASDFLHKWCGGRLIDRRP